METYLIISISVNVVTLTWLLCEICKKIYLKRESRKQEIDNLYSKIYKQQAEIDQLKFDTKYLLQKVNKEKYEKGDKDNE